MSSLVAAWPARATRFSGRCSRPSVASARPPRSLRRRSPTRGLKSCHLRSRQAREAQRRLLVVAFSPISERGWATDRTEEYRGRQAQRTPFRPRTAPPFGSSRRNNEEQKLVGHGGSDRHARRRVLEHAGDTGTWDGEAVNRGITARGVTARGIAACGVTTRSVATGRVTTGCV